MPVTKILLVISFLLLYHFYSSSGLNNRSVEIIIVFAVLFQALYGLMQITGIIGIAYCLARIDTGKKYYVNCGVLYKTVITSVIVLCSMGIIKDIVFEYRWGRLAQKSIFGSNDKLLKNYESLNEKWNGNTFFLYNYGALLHDAQIYPYSNVIMGKCRNYYNDYNVQMILAENHSHLGETYNAEKYFITAHNMIPNKFLPLYKMMMLYDVAGESDKALATAKIIIGKEVKIPSIAIYEMIYNARIIVDKYSSKD